MRTIELFCGTKSFSRVMGERGHSTFTVDINAMFKPDLTIDILQLNINLLPKNPDILWASPPCQGFSVATIGRYWNKDYTPKHETSAHAIKLVEKTIEIINNIKPKYWFIENPRGMLRKSKIMAGFHRKTITYCQYGDARMKPTDIWTNLISWEPKPSCKNNASCHMPAPRGSRCGTQGLKIVWKEAKYRDYYLRK